MNCGFLQNYTIPRITGDTVPPTTEQVSKTVQNVPHQRNPNILVNKSRRLLKRKHSNEEIIAETTPEGKLILFDGRDASYPDELNKLIHPRKCDLCKAEMNSLISARDHFKSKPHDRNITAWLKTNYTERGLEAPPVKRFLPKGPTGPDVFHCKLCDLKLTSLTHANQHYAGRKHRLVAENISKPSGAGYYNEAGIWVRTGTKVLTKLINDGRFGTSETVHEIAEVNLVPPGEEFIKKALHCAVCDVYTTSQVQMETHLKGSKHGRKLKAKSLEVEPQIAADVAIPMDILDVPAIATATVLEACNADPSNGEIDFSAYRTPSGSYYCKTCDLSLVNVMALQQHLNGKKHLKRAADERDSKTSYNIKK